MNYPITTKTANPNDRTPYYAELFKSWQHKQAETFDVPLEWIEGATYLGKGNSYLWYGEGYLALLASLATRYRLGRLFFKKHTYTVYNSKKILDAQESITNEIFVTEMAKQNKAIADYHVIDSANLTTIYENPHEYIFVHKINEKMRSCTINWTYVDHDGKHVTDGNTTYCVNYKNTSVGRVDSNGVPAGAWVHLPTVMLLRAKKKAYFDAFQASDKFILKALELKKTSSEEDKKYIEATEVGNDDISLVEKKRIEASKFVSFVGNNN